MKGLEIIAGKVTRRLRDKNCVTDNHQIKKAKVTKAVLEAYPVWLMVYSVDPLGAVYINRKMADFLEVPAGFIKTEDEYRTVHNCDSATAYNRFQTFEYYLNGGTGTKRHVATILSPEDTPVIIDDLASPIVVDDREQTKFYAHFFAERNRPSIVNAYSFCDPDDLTPKQRQVMICLLRQWPLPRIMEHMRIKPKTLEKHIAAILAVTDQPHVGALLEKCALSD